MTIDLSIDFLHNLFDDIFKINDEVCGSLQLENNKLNIFNKIKGKRDVNGRGSCMPVKIVGSKINYLYHTHPINSYAYPSFEDLWSVMKRQSEYSFIATQWGIFVVIPRGKKAPEKNHEKYKRYFKNNIIEFHENTKQDSHVSKPYNECVLEIIKFINLVNRLFGIKRRSRSKSPRSRSKSPRRSRSKSPRRSNSESNSKGNSKGHSEGNSEGHLHMYFYSWKDIADEKMKGKEYIEIET